MDLPPPLSEKEIQELLPKLREGDKATKERVITGYMRLAISIANRYGYNDREVIHSAALYGVCFAIDRVIKGFLEHDNLSGFVIKHIHRFCKEELLNKKTLPLYDVPDNYVGGTVELFDLFDFLIKDDVEKQIIRLRMNGLVDGEIAEMLNLSKSFVYRIRKNFQERFLTWRKNHDN